MPKAAADPVDSPPAPAIGVLLPQEEGPGDPEPTWRLISAAARRAEEVGLDSVWLVDHVVWHVDPWNRDPGAFGEAARPGGYGVREAWAALAAVAATTTRVRLGTLVTCTRYRNPALLANMAAYGAGDQWRATRSRPRLPPRTGQPRQ
jgi:alkanesulfonate monooxygenase SsuD/methylene tetrahydromethanopterin reductase-like flavin-dependent oxidoreductase (luciferase family)